MALVTCYTIFVHVPKTGGSSVRSMIAKAGIECWESGDLAVEDHYGLPELRAAHASCEAGRISFGFVRHPVSWIKSRWAWAVISGFPQKVRKEPAAAAHWMAHCWDDDCARFVAQYLERFPGICTQTCFKALGLWSGTPVKMIGKTETLEQDLTRILRHAGEKFETLAPARERVGAGGRLKEQTALPLELERRVMIAERTLCDRFGYI